MNVSGRPIPKTLKVRHFSLLSHGGAWVASDRIANEISKLGFDCETIGVKANFKNHELLLNRIGGKIDFEISKSGFIKGSLYKSTSSGQSILQSVRRNSVDLINFHWIPGKITNYLEEIVSKFNVVFTLHDMNLFTGFCHHSGVCNEFQESCANCPQALTFISHQISNSQFRKQKILSLNPNLQFISPSRWLASQAAKSSALKNAQISVVKNPVPLEIYKPGMKASAQSKIVKMAILGSDTDETKGVSRIIPILRDLVGSYPIGYLQFLVLGRKHKELPMDIQQELRVEGNDLEMSKALSSCDLMLYSSKFENLPSLLTESQACGVPILAMDVGGVGETFIPEESGQLVPESQIDFRNCLIYLLDSPEKLREFSINARKFSEREFNGAKIAAQYLDIYSKAYFKL